jgi:ubiquinone biosynthesis protein UbiJ
VTAAPSNPADTLFRPFELLLNRGVAESVDAARLCRELEGRSLQIDFEGLPLALRLVARGGALAVGIADGDPADCHIGGLPISMLRLALTGDQQGLRAGTLRLSGDPALARDFQRLLSLARPDWEEELARQVGDVVAHQLGNLARGTLSWLQRAADTLTRDAGEFLKEESRDLPSRPEVEAFLDEVDRVAADLGRVEARIARLERERGK